MEWTGRKGEDGGKNCKGRLAGEGGIGEYKHKGGGRSLFMRI